MLTALFLLTTVLTPSEGVVATSRGGEASLDQAFLGQAPLMGLSSGRGTLASAEGVTQMKEGDSLVELPLSGHMEVAAASEMELRWMGRGSIELTGASAFEWSGSAFGQAEGDLFRMIKVSSADIEVRRGPLRIGLPGQVVLTVERGALEVEANPSGKYSIRLFGGESLDLSFPTADGQGHMEIKPGKSMWIDPAILVGVAEARDLALRQLEPKVAVQVLLAEPAEQVVPVQPSEPEDRLEPEQITEPEQVDGPEQPAEQIQPIDHTAALVPSAQAPGKEQALAGGALARNQFESAQWAAQVPIAAWTRQEAAPSRSALIGKPMFMKPLPFSKDPIALLIADPIMIEAAEVPAMESPSVFDQGSPSELAPRFEPWSQYAVNGEAGLEPSQKLALASPEEHPSSNAISTEPAHEPVVEPAVQPSLEVEDEQAAALALKQLSVSPLAVYLPDALAPGTSRHFHSPIPSPWSPVPVVLAPSDPAPQPSRGTNAALELSDLINGLVEYEEIDW
jgi:hypothetical protein